MLLYARVGDLVFLEVFCNFKVLSKSDKFELDSALEKSGLVEDFNSFCASNKKLSTTKKYLRFFDSIQNDERIKELRVKVSTGFSTKREVFGGMAEYV